MQKKEDNMETRIKNMKKERNRMRMQNQRQLPPAKRQKTDEGAIPVEKPKGVECSTPTKRKDTSEETQQRKKQSESVSSPLPIGYRATP